jgi:hypothetical protein
MDERPSLVTENQLLKAFLQKAIVEMQAIRKALSTEAFDIDEWKYEQSALTFQPLQTYDGPVVITSLLAIFPTSSTSVLINTGQPGRIIPITNIAAGFLALDDLRIQLGKDDVPRNMVIAPAGTGYINFFGYADKKVIEHRP